MKERKIDGHAILGEEFHLQLSADELLRRMDRAQIDVAIARPMGAGLTVKNREGNNVLLTAHPRIRAMISVNPWFGAEALEEMRRCHDLGAVGLFLHPSRQGFQPNDDLVFPLIEAAAEWKWPILFHTGTYIQSDIIGLGWLAERYSSTAFTAGFGGFTDMWFDLPAVFKRHSNLYLDTSMMWSDAIMEIINLTEGRRVIFGGAEPRNRYAAATHAIDLLPLGEAQRHAVFSGNAARLFQLS